MAERKVDHKDALDFAWRVHSYTNDYIRFADQKAALLLAAQTALVAALYSAKLHQACSPARLDWAGASPKDTLLGGAALAAFAALLTGCAYAVAAIAPRLRTQFYRTLRERLLGSAQPAPKGDIYWKSVLAYASAGEYAQRIKSTDAADQTQAVCEHTYVLASIADGKFDNIVRSLGFGVFGAAAGVATLFTS